MSDSLQTAAPVVVLQHINGHFVLGKLLDDMEHAFLVGDPLSFSEGRAPSGQPVIHVADYLPLALVEKTNAANEVLFAKELIERVLTPKDSLVRIYTQHTSKLDLTTPASSLIQKP